MAKTEGRTLPSELGTVKIADEVVSIIAGLAATEVEGVASMSGGLTGGISEVLGRKSFSKGVKVEVSTEEAKIDIFLTVKYGERIPDVAWDIQESVKKAIEKMTGLTVSSVNIHVQGVQFPQQENDETEGSEVTEQAAAETEL